MVSAGSWRRRFCGLFLVLGCLAGLSACSTSGRSFDSSALSVLIPGYTTLEEASSLLGSEPVDVYRRLDGSATARWAHKASFVTDAIYFNQELWLAFDANGRYQGVVESNNIPRAYQAGQAGQVSDAAMRAGQTWK